MIRRKNLERVTLPITVVNKNKESIYLEDLRLIRN